MPCWAVLASDRAEMPSDCRVERACEFAASSLRSALVRFDEPVSSTLIRFFVKSWRFCTTERFEPKVEESDRSWFDALVRLVSVLLMSLFRRKQPCPPTVVPEEVPVIACRPERPDAPATGWPRRLSDRRGPLRE